MAQREDVRKDLTELTGLSDDDIDEFIRNGNFMPNVYILLSMQGFKAEGFGDAINFLERTKEIVRLVELSESKRKAVH